jgi:hypothetical protein
MKLPDDYKQRFERRVSEQLAAIHEEEIKKRALADVDFSSRGTYYQRFITAIDDLIESTKRKFGIEVNTLIETYQECGTRPDDLDYDDYRKRLETIAQTHINNFRQSHDNNVFTKNNVPNLEQLLESLDHKIKVNMHRALEKFKNFIEDEKLKAQEENRNRKTGF